MSAASQFPANQAPDGRSEALAALDTLCRTVPALARCNRAKLYEVCRPFFAAGWCVRDIQGAMDASPDGTAYFGGEVFWTSTDEPDRMLHRMASRLRAWRLTDAEQEIMVGPYTAQARAMMARAEDQRFRASIRQIEYDERARVTASGCAGRVAAQYVAEMSTQAGRAHRRAGDRREMDHRARVAGRALGNPGEGDRS